MDLSLVTSISNLLQLDISSQGEGGDIQIQFKEYELKKLELHQQGDSVWGYLDVVKHQIYFIYILFGNTSATTHNTYHIHK